MPSIESLERRTLLSISFSDPNQLTNAADFGKPLVTDVNGDGRPDLIVPDASGLQLMLGLGSGNFSLPQTIATGILSGAPGSESTISMAAADVNGDGNPDLIVSSGRTLSVLLGNGNGTFKAPQTYDAGISEGTTSLAVGDINGDGHPDIVITNSANQLYSVDVLLGNGNGTFEAPQSIAVDGDPTSVSLVDVNGDGIPDLVLALDHYNGPGVVGVSLGNGNGTFQPEQTFAVGEGPDSLVATDLNGDGKVDLAVANGTSPHIDILLGNGDGTFQTAQTVATSAGTASLAAADLRGDGKMDLIASYSGLNRQGIDVLLGNGNGTLLPLQTITAGIGPIDLTVADINGDGLPDLLSITANHNPITTQYEDLLVAQYNEGYSTFATQAGGPVIVNGTPGADSITVTDSSGFVVNENGQTAGPYPDATGVYVDGGAGNDTISTPDVPVSVTLCGAAGDDSITGGPDGGSLRGGTGNDTIQGNTEGAQTETILGKAGNDSISDAGGDNLIHGGIGNDTIVGGSFADTINGNFGDDSIVAGVGSDEIFAGPGDDTVQGSTAMGDNPDTIYCGAGIDSVLAGLNDSVLNVSGQDTVNRTG